MDDKETIKMLTEALMFYRNADNYWGEPIDLDTPVDRNTLRIANRHRDAAPIIQDWGRVAATALIEAGIMEKDEMHERRGPGVRN